MAKLVVDLEQLQQTINDYKKSIEEFTKMKGDLEKAIEDLKSSGWVSGASTAYFETYEDTWKSNMEMHMKILGHLEDCLVKAKADYDELYVLVPSLGDDL